MTEKIFLDTKNKDCNGVVTKRKQSFKKISQLNSTTSISFYNSDDRVVLIISSWIRFSLSERILKSF